MQEHHLLSGSIADSICFFDATFNQERLIACAQLPGIIHDEIMAMLMSYNSLIGDRGVRFLASKNSALLARALYPQPKLLPPDAQKSIHV
jgi:ATP-binding cassette, subfamily B, bacterial CvaB/MchF/RaxB